MLTLGLEFVILETLKKFPLMFSGEKLTVIKSLESMAYISTFLLDISYLRVSMIVLGLYLY